MENEFAEALVTAVTNGSKRIAAAIMCAGMMMSAHDVPSGQAATIYEELLDKIGGKQ